MARVHTINTAMRCALIDRVLCFSGQKIAKNLSQDIKTAEINEACEKMVSQIKNESSKDALKDHRLKCGPTHKYIYKGKDTAPNMTSANAMFITRSKLFLRSFFFIAKKAIVSKFPATINTASNTKALHSAIPSARGGTSIEDKDGTELFGLVEVDIFSI